MQHKTNTMKRSKLIIANSDFESIEKVILNQFNSGELDIQPHKPYKLNSLENGRDIYFVELINLNGRNLLKCLEEKKIWCIAVIKNKALLREVVGYTHTICLYPEYSLRELYTSVSKLLALLKTNNEAARPAFSKQNLIHPNISKLLTQREQEMLLDITQGKMYKEIADNKGITIGTVKQHIHKIYNKMHVSNKIEALNMCGLGA